MPFGKGMNKRTKDYSDETSKYVNVVRECIQGKKEIESYGRQDIFINRHAEANKRVEKNAYQQVFISWLQIWWVDMQIFL